MNRRRFLASLAAAFGALSLPLSAFARESTRAWNENDKGVMRCDVSFFTKTGDEWALREDVPRVSREAALAAGSRLSLIVRDALHDRGLTIHDYEFWRITLSVFPAHGVSAPRTGYGDFSYVPTKRKDAAWSAASAFGYLYDALNRHP